jgi:tRNA (guanine37-N1)-methyltransferase
MVMRPEPFGEAFADLGVDRATTVVFTTPSGEPLTQELARELATRERIVFACGRYEGIDQRVLDHAGTLAELREISIGDYVLNGGEVAALAITEAVVRLLPGFMGNAESLVEESHSGEGVGLLEYPVYTKPASWQGRDVPPVLLSGDHGRIAAWRHEQRLSRTAERRPDLLHASAAETEWEIVPATRADAGEILTLQRACWLAEAVDADSFEIPALKEDLATVLAGLGEWRTYVVRSAGRLVGSVRGRLDDGPAGERIWDIGRLMVAPDLQGRGLGRVLLEHIQAVAPAEATSYWLFTGARAARNQRIYKKAGFRLRRDLAAPPLAVVMTKRRISGS